MGREIRTEEDARRWLEDSMAMKGNSCLSAEQAKALSEWLDGLQDLINVHDVNPMYMIGSLETAKMMVYEYAQECVERAMELAGMGE